MTEHTCLSPEVHHIFQSITSKKHSIFEIRFSDLLFRYTLNQRIWYIDSYNVVVIVDYPMINIYVVFSTLQFSYIFELQ